MANKTTPKDEKFLCACTPDHAEEYCHNRNPEATKIDLTSTEEELKEKRKKPKPEVNPGYAKNAKYYYTVDEWGLKNSLVKLFKKKQKRKPKKCCCLKPDPERIPLTECQIRVVAWQTHDLSKCEEIEKDTFLGEIIFPFCSRAFAILENDPGVPVRQSLKSFCINNRKSFGDKFLERRKYAYQGVILTSSCVCN